MDAQGPGAIHALAPGPFPLPARRVTTLTRALLSRSAGLSRSPWGDRAL